MAKPFVFRLASDVSEWLRGAKATTDSIEDIADELEKLDDKEIDLDHKLQQGTKEALELHGRLEELHDETEKIEESAAQTGKALRQEFASAAEAVDKTEVSSGSLANALQDLEANAEKAPKSFKDGWKDAVSSFDGSLETGIEGAFRALMNFAGAAGLGGAIGGLFASGVVKLGEHLVSTFTGAAEKVEQRNRAMYDQMLQNQSAYFSDEQITENFWDMMNGSDGAFLDQETLAAYAKTTGMAMQEVALAFADTRSEIAGEFEARLKVADARLEAAAAAYEADNPGAGLNMAEAEFSSEGAAIPSDVIESWRAFTGVVEESSGQIKSNQEFLREHGVGAASAAEATRAFIEAQSASTEALQSTQAQIAANIETYGDAAAAMDENQAALSDLAGALVSEQRAAEEANATTSEMTALQIDQAAAFLEAAGAAGIETDAALDLGQQLGLIPKEVATLIRNRGVEEAKNQADDVRQALGRIPTSVSTKILAIGNAAQAAAEVDRIERSLRAISVSINPRYNRTATLE